VRYELKFRSVYLEYQSSYLTVCCSFTGVGFKTWVRNVQTCIFESTAILHVETAFRVRVFERIEVGGHPEGFETSQLH
jgi:hypothetical protein